MLAAMAAAVLVAATTPAGLTLAPVRDPAMGTPRDRAYVVKALEPGATATDTVRASNNSDLPIDLRIGAVDAVVNGDGAFAPLADGSRTGAGAWLTVSPAMLHLSPHATANIAVAIAVPPDAGAGDHLAAITATDTTLRPGPAGSGVAIVDRVAVRAYLTVTGAGTAAEPRAALSVKAFQWTGAPNGRRFAVTVANAGRRIASPAATLTLSQGDLTARVDLGVIGDVPAGEERTIPLAAPGALPSGTWTASLVLRTDGGAGPSPSMSTTFTVPEAAGNEGATTAGPVPGEAPLRHGDRPVVSFAVVARAAAVVLFAGVVGIALFGPGRPRRLTAGRR